MKTLITLLIFAAGCVTPPVDPGQPSPSPSPSPVASPAASPSPSPTPLPKPGSSTPPVKSACVGPNESQSQYSKFINSAMDSFKTSHEEQFTPGTSCLKSPNFWDAYYFDVVALLNKFYPVEAIVDDCAGAGICGEIAVKGKGVLKGTGFSEQHQVLNSKGCMRYSSAGAFRARCTPAWFDK